MHSNIANLLLHSYIETYCYDAYTSRFTFKDANASCTVTTTLIENTAPQHVFFLPIKMQNEYRSQKGKTKSANWTSPQMLSMP